MRRLLFRPPAGVSELDIAVAGGVQECAPVSGVTLQSNVAKLLQHAPMSGCHTGLPFNVTGRCTQSFSYADCSRGLQSGASYISGSCGSVSPLLWYQAKHVDRISRVLTMGNCVFFTCRCVTFLFLIGGASAQQEPRTDPWAGVRFLVGTWEGEITGQPGRGTSEREYRFVLNNRYLHVRNKSSYPPQPKNPKGELHEDWGMISHDRARKKLILRQFHVEGFVNQFSGEAGSDGVMRFTSESIENIAAGYRARETYTVTGPDSFIERFELAASGKDFELYSETRFRRKN